MTEQDIDTEPAQAAYDEAEPETCYEQDPDLSDGPADDPDGAEDPAEAEGEEALESVRPYRLAEALSALKVEVNAAAPHRKTASDGWIGDAAHASRSSDHNPWVIDGGRGVVTAIDITHDPAGGCDSYRLADVLRKSHDRRIKYIISKGRIASAAPKGTVPAWTWRAYSGTNPHNHHCHISVQPTKALYDSRSDWAIDGAFGAGLESLAIEAPDDPIAEIELALAALAADATDAARPLLPRLTALQEAAGGLLSRYSDAMRGEDADDGGESGEESLEAPGFGFDDLADGYRQLYASCAIVADKQGVVAWHRKMLLKGRPRYEEVAAQTGVPWWFVGIIHAMEASFNFVGHLHNGDPLAARTVHVPAGRPDPWNPPTGWVASAVDALRFQKFAQLSDWSLARALYRWEAYNGFGTRRRGLNTPYLWSFSNHYSKGKFVRDGVWDPQAVSKQCGAAVMLKALEQTGDVAL